MDNGGHPSIIGSGGQSEARTSHEHPTITGKHKGTPVVQRSVNYSQNTVTEMTRSVKASGSAIKHGSEGRIVIPQEESEPHSDADAKQPNI